ncbi:PREDICTED: uncharacterized protein LOC107186203 [Dufourea novaeangliae]|uniref:uncharacterized protein LOC107186203 n=1 Tax=Dufourea novaeangliae TaxID=178035 RepID=UPI000767A1B2|nr:PREDICTED: uncharacterized protein LOC107186203 [Dufourea novaeangliae]
MRHLLLFVVIHQALMPVQSFHGVIWDKKLDDFVPIVNVPEFAYVIQERMSRIREKELHNFQGAPIKMSYFEIPRSLESKNNGTRLTGAIGDIWHLLSEFLNFTLRPTVVTERNLGSALPNGSYTPGLLKKIHLNEIDVIPRLDGQIDRLAAAQFTLPLWIARYYLYIRPEVHHLTTWMLKLLSPKVWYAGLVTYILLTICNYMSHVIHATIMRQKPVARLTDHFFYNFGTICDQSYFLTSSGKSSKLIELVLGMFSLLFRTAYNSLVIGYMTKVFNVLPVDNIPTLLDHTSYKIVAVKGSLPSINIQTGQEPINVKIRRMNRYYDKNTVTEVFQEGCARHKLIATIISTDMKKCFGEHFCPLTQAGEVIYKSIIISGISWHFKHKRSIDIGLLRLYEHGFIRLLKQRWIDSKNVENYRTNPFEPIMMEQIYLALSIFFGGLLISCIILIIENVTFRLNK